MDFLESRRFDSGTTRACAWLPSRTQLSSVFPEMHRLSRREHCGIDKARHAGLPKRKLLLFQQAKAERHVWIQVHRFIL
jgi:hypothetical protein